MTLNDMSNFRRNESNICFITGDGNNYPFEGCTVTIHYTGYWEKGDGELHRFDSTHDRGKPFKFVLGAGQVIEGLNGGVAQLSVGETAKVFIKSHYAYGTTGFPGLIPSNADLMFEIDLLSISK